MDMHYQTMLITLHEPALYCGHDVSDFRPPYALRPLPISTKNGFAVEMHAAGLLVPCVLSSQALVRTFLSLPIETLLSMPVVTYTRVTYATIVFIKCFVSAKAYPCLADLYLETSLDPVSAVSQLLGKLKSVRDQPQGRIPVPAVFYSILSTIYTWCTKVFATDTCQNVGDLMEPMLYLNLEDDKNLSDPEVETAKPWIGQHRGIEIELASTVGFFDWKELNTMGDMRFDAWTSELFPGCSDFLDHVDPLFLNGAQKGGI